MSPVPVPAWACRIRGPGPCGLCSGTGVCWEMQVSSGRQPGWWCHEAQAPGEAAAAAGRGCVAQAQAHAGQRLHCPPWARGGGVPCCTTGQRQVVRQRQHPLLTAMARGSQMEHVTSLQTFAQSPRCASCHWPLTRASPSGYQRQEAGWARPQARTCDAGAVGSWTRAAAQQGAPQTWGGGPGKPPQKGPLSWVLKEKYESSLRRKGTEIWDDANLRAQELAKRDGWVNVPPFDHPLIWEGNASLVRELKATLGTPPGAVVLAVGGGGLLAGVVAGLVEVGWQHVPIIAMETRGAHSFNAAVEAGKLVTLPDITSVAKSLGAKTVAARALECTRECRVLSEVVDDAEAVSAVQRFLDDERLLVEPACGAALAFIYSGLLGRLQAEGRLGPLASVVVIVCGGNGINSGELQALKAKLGQS
ncbi:serine dehydratase-like [Marmota monax]|uniref:L-serine deaminase n=1 Tax=Marmota monax TaxID=9995 RepID=A0A834UL34_MARMO|nr:serine dehydratase-like [Marmota monax]KAF7464326.1 serine dehydratase-like [Marmota monax]KAF7464330.1 serine dehydratase-like [Marmota monax]